MRYHRREFVLVDSPVALGNSIVEVGFDGVNPIAVIGFIGAF